MNLQPINAAASPEVQMNENFEVLDWATVYAKNPVTTSGLAWGYYGGRWGGNLVAAGVLTLAYTSTNYVVVRTATGAISVSTTATNWDDTANYARVYELTTDSGVVTVVEDHRAGPYGILSISPASTPRVQAVAYAANVTLDCSLYDVFDFAALTGNVSITLSGMVDGQKVELSIPQDGTGGRTITFTNTLIFGADVTAITTSTTPSLVDEIALRYKASASGFRVLAVSRGYTA